MKISLAMAVLALALSAAGLAAQQPQQRPPRDSAGRAEMMSKMQQHMRTMDSTSAVLDSLVGRMNRATGSAKVDAMAQVINALVSERRTTQSHMRQMMQSHGNRMQGHMRGRTMKRMPADSSRGQTSDTSGASR